MATDPNTLINGTVADANQVEAKFDVLFTDVDETNVDQTAIMVLTNVDQTVLGEKSFTTTNGIKVPGAYPTETRGIGTTEDGLLGLYGASALFKLISGNRTACLVYNMRLSYSSGTFKVVGHDGNDLSATNRGIVIAHNNSGTGFNVCEFTSSPSFQDDAHAGDSDFVGTGTMSWGTTAATAWSPAMPFLLGVCTDGTTPIMVIARGPVGDTGASSNIGYWDNAPSAASQNNVFALTATNVTVTHASQKITWIGSFRMVKSAADDWTVQALDKNDGIQNFYNYGKRRHTMAQGQNGAAASRFMLANGGTTPQWSTMFYEYILDFNTGFCTIAFRFDGDGGTDGAGAVNALVATPFTNQATSNSYAGTGYAKWAATNEQNVTINPDNLVSNTAIAKNTSATARVLFTNADFSAGARTLEGSVTYPAFV